MPISPETCFPAKISMSPGKDQPAVVSHLFYPPKRRVKRTDGPGQLLGKAQTIYTIRETEPPRTKTIRMSILSKSNREACSA